MFEARGSTEINPFARLSHFFVVIKPCAVNLEGQARSERDKTKYCITVLRWAQCLNRAETSGTTWDMLMLIIPIMHGIKPMVLTWRNISNSRGSSNFVPSLYFLCSLDIFGTSSSAALMKSFCGCRKILTGTSSMTNSWIDPNIFLCSCVKKKKKIV